MSEWFERWFGEEYLAIYPHRDDEEAERLVEWLAGRPVFAPGERVLDLACGAGRHVPALAGRGAKVVGFDLSLPLLRAARRRGVASLVRGDMRLLGVASGSFDAVLNLFTSFGYFESDDDHARVVGEVARVLTRGGRFVLDYFNEPYVRANLVARDETRAAGRQVVQEREISPDGRSVIKRIHVGGEGRWFEERVRLFSRDDLEGLLRRAGLEVAGAFGDYRGAEWSPGSPRLVLLAERA